jgi:hypothetical protein
LDRRHAAHSGSARRQTLHSLTLVLALRRARAGSAGLERHAIIGPNGAGQVEVVLR